MQLDADKQKAADERAKEKEENEKNKLNKQ